MGGCIVVYMGQVYIGIRANCTLLRQSVKQVHTAKGIQVSTRPLSLPGVRPKVHSLIKMSSSTPLRASKVSSRYQPVSRP